MCGSSINDFVLHILLLQGSVEEAVARTTQHYEGLLKLVRSELVAKHEKEKLTMAGEIRQLEDRVANILKEQQRVSDGGRHYSSGSEIGGGGGGGRPLSQASISEVDLQRLRPLVRTAMTNIKQDMLALVSWMYIFYDTIIILYNYHLLLTHDIV